jgi:DNA-binding XRE family transcriptional regulator
MPGTQTKKPPTPAELLGEKIYLARCQSRMSQLYLASQVHVHQQAISDFETGKREPKPTVLMAIARVLGKRLQYFDVTTEQK